MTHPTDAVKDEMAQAEALPQLDASSLVDGERLEAEVKDMYRHVAREEEAELHFEVGRDLAEHLGYPRSVLDAIPAEALASFAGVGYHLDLAALEPGDAVLDLGSGSGTDVFCAAVLVGETGRVVGVDITDEQLAKAARLRDRDGFLTGRARRGAHRGAAVRGRELRRRHLERRHQPLAGQGPGVRRGGAGPAAGREAGVRRHRQRQALKERTRRNVELWAACIAGAIPQRNYVRGDRAQGFEVNEVRKNDYRFISERALDACNTYEVESVSMVAVKTR